MTSRRVPLAVGAIFISALLVGGSVSFAQPQREPHSFIWMQRCAISFSVLSLSLC